ncbi:MAG: DUF2460 domain-containing protein [Acidobacteriaceae bacterium]
MSNAIYPALRGLAWTVGKQAGFSTLVHSAPDKYEVRISQMRNPIWSFKLIYEFLKDNPLDLQPGLTDTDLRTLMGFYLARNGQFDDFLLEDPTDNYSGPAMLNGAPNVLAELPLVTDGLGNYFSPLQRSMGGFFEDITDPNGSVTVYANGVLTNAFTVEGPGLAVPGASYLGRFLAWTTGLPMPSAATLTAVAGGALAATQYFVKIAFVGATGTSAASAESSMSVGVGTPTAPVLSAVVSGALAAATYYGKVTYVDPFGETLPSAETSLAIAADSVPSVASPAASGDATGYNVYLSTATGTETLQNSTPIAIGTAWTAPATGLIAGAALPSASTAYGLLSVASPDNPAAEIEGATGYNVYAGTSSGAETLQNATPIALGTAWTEPTTGLTTTGAGAPTVNTFSPATPITAQFNFYFRVRFESDQQEFENFMNELWTIGGSESKSGSQFLTLVTSRPNPL